MSTHDTEAPNDDLDARFASFRSLPTPPPIPVDQLPVPRSRPNPRWLAVAAAVVALTLISVALLTSGRYDPDELTTTSPPATGAPSSTTPAPGATRPAPTTTPSTTASPPTTSTVPSPSPSSPTATEPQVTQPPTTVAREPIPPPASVPLGAPIPEGQWPVQFHMVRPLPTEGSTTIGVTVSYAECAGTEVPGPRLHDPVVTETAEAVVITFWADALGPPDQVFTCPAIMFSGDEPPDYTVTLSAPLGKRWVYDGRPPFPESTPAHLVLDPNLREP